MKLRETVDLSQITIEELTWNQQYFRFKQPLTFIPRWTVKQKELNLYVFAKNRDRKLLSKWLLCGILMWRLIKMS